MKNVPSSDLPAGPAAEDVELVLKRYYDLRGRIAQGVRSVTLAKELSETVHSLIGMAGVLLRTANEACDMPSQDRTGPAIEALSRREREVLRHVIAGRTSKEIATLLRVSPASISTYRSRLMTKLDAKRSTDLVRRALELGLPGDPSPIADTCSC